MSTMIIPYILIYIFNTDFPIFFILDLKLQKKTFLNAYQNIRSRFGILASQTLEPIIMGVSLKHCHAHRIWAVKSEKIQIFSEY